MYLKANCPDCTAHIAKLEAEKEHLADVAEDHIDVTEIHRKRIAKLEADLDKYKTGAWSNPYSEGENNE